MTAADVNTDGVDDIAFTYGNRMLSDIVDVPVDNLYRTGLAVGDVDSDGLVAQSSVRWEDESDGSQDWERYYEWNARAADFTGSGQELICLNYAYLTTGANALWYTGLKQKCVFASVSDSSVSKVWEDSPEDKNVNGWENSAAIPYCLPNTDNDTIVLRYTGKHYYTYADPDTHAYTHSGADAYTYPGAYDPACCGKHGCKRSEAGPVQLSAQLFHTDQIYTVTQRKLCLSPLQSLCHHQYIQLLVII